MAIERVEMPDGSIMFRNTDLLQEVNPQVEDCPDCKGIGKHLSENKTYWYECASCAGTGRFELTQEHAGGLVMLDIDGENIECERAKLDEIKDIIFRDEDTIPQVPSACPNCGSDDLNCYGSNHEDEIIWRDYQCLHCKVVWSETYRFTGWKYL